MQNKLFSTPIFYPGLAGSNAYRIPSMITTKQGTVIAGIDARIANSNDNPNKIETTIRRSTDNGETWGPVQKLVTYAGEGVDGAAAIDTSLLQDAETGTIWMLFCHTPGGIGLWQSEPGVGFDETGRRLLYDTNDEIYYVDKMGNVYDQSNSKTAYHIDNHGNVFLDGKTHGNIYFKKGVAKNECLVEARTSFLQVIRSDDDGVTWSEPLELNAQVKEPWMKFIGTGPGRGLQLKGEKYEGRLVFPIYFSNEHSKMSCAVIYSDNNGETWQRGDSPNDGRIFRETELNAKTNDVEDSDLTESQIVELPNGDLNAYIRNHSGRQRTMVAVSKDGGVSWKGLSFAESLKDPTCQSTVLTYPDMGDGKTRLLFVNPADDRKRCNGTVRLSEDGGESWEYERQIEEGAFIYSCLTVLQDGRIGLLYETVRGDAVQIHFAMITLDWVKGN